MSSKNRIFLATLTTATLLALAACGGPSEAELTTSARALLQAKDTKGALIQLKSALQKNPQSAEARLLMGKVLLASGDAVSALVELRKAQELQVPDEEVVPELGRAMLLAGEETKLIAQYGELKLRDASAAADLKTSVATARAVKGDSEGARAAIADALAMRPTFVPAKLLLARLRAAEGDVDGSLALADEILAAEPTNERAGLLRADLLWRAKKDPAAAEQAFEKVLGSHPGSIGAHVAIITMRFDQRKVAEAKAQFELLKKAAPDHPETVLFGAQFAFSEKDYKAARELLDRVLKVAPDSVRALELAGAAEYRLKNFIQAEAFLGRAIKNAPGLLLSRQLLAQTYLRTGQPDKAIEALRPIIESASPDGASLALAGEAWLQTGDTAKSTAAFSAATKASPNDARVRTSAAMAQLGHGKGNLAIAELESIAAGDAGPRADLALVSARLRQQDLAGALRAIDGLERKLPDRPLAYHLRGRVLLLKRDTAAAARSFETALTKDSMYFPAVASLAAIDLAGSKPEAARKRFDDFLKVQPKSHQAALALAELAARTSAPPTEVTRLLRDAVKINAAEPAPHMMLVAHLLSAGDAKAALVAAQEGVAALPSNLDLMEALGRAQLATGDANQAVSTFKSLSGLQARNPSHLVRLADAYAMSKDRDSAARALSRALEIQPDFRPAHRARVALALTRGQTQEALDLVRLMQKRDAKDASAWVMEAEIEAGRKNWGPASAAYRTALARGAGSDTAAKLHQVLLQASKGDEAERFAEDWRREHPTDAVFVYYLGDLALAKGDFTKAESHYRKVLELQPKNALAMNNIAWLMVKSAKPGAVSLAQEADTLMPNTAPILDTLALAQAAEGQVSKAVETQRRAMALSPQDHDLKLGLARHLIQAGEKAKAKAELDTLAALGSGFAKQAEVTALLSKL